MANKFVKSCALLLSVVAGGGVESSPARALNETQNEEIARTQLLRGSSFLQEQQKVHSMFGFGRKKGPCAGIVCSRVADRGSCLNHPECCNLYESGAQGSWTCKAGKR
ncbi:unnamed protein product [Amoebophrya sp. A25]|nr:unnamed protein product [Amoebophrya sp. A25]|eukprot:GSA25T00019136001.1